MFGLLNVNKPKGKTSRDVVNLVQRLLRPEKVGHAGTLDPLATGVLILAVGQATRLVPFLQQVPKRYVGTFLLGRRSDTDDVEGDVTLLETEVCPARARIEAVLPDFQGRVMQRPPSYSAVKVKGRRAYQLARQGHLVRLEPRPVEVYRLDIVEYAYPRLVLDILCGSGTYIRSLGRDIAQALKTGAVMSDLCRTEIGSFLVRDACEADRLTADSIRQSMIPAARAVEHLPSIKLGPEQLGELAHGRRVHGPPLSVGQMAAVIDADGQLRAIVESVQRQLFKPVRNFT